MFQEPNRGMPKLPTLRAYREMTPLKRREMREGLLYISPWLIGFCVFTLLPIIASLIFSFMDLKITDGITQTPHVRRPGQLRPDGQRPADLVDWQRHPRLAVDYLVVWYDLAACGSHVAAGDRNPDEQPAPQGADGLPQHVLHALHYPLCGGCVPVGRHAQPGVGWINRALISLGVPRESTPNWANDINWVYPTYVIMGIWGIGNAMLIFLAGLQGVPTDLYDAAKVDGANAWQAFSKVTFPMISPVVFYNLVLGVVFLFQFFLIPLVVNQGTGRPGGATMFFNLYLYKTFFTFQNMSYGATMAWLLFFLILIVTVFLFGTAKYWVYYAGEKRS